MVRIEVRYMLGTLPTPPSVETPERRRSVARAPAQGTDPDRFRGPTGGKVASMTDPAAMLQSRATEVQRANRAELRELFASTPIPADELMVNLPLYMRSSAVAKLLYVDELYRMIVDVPGSILEFGVWWGANLALFESLRAVHEPYNYTRAIVGFDTFEGYSSPSAQDGADPLVREGAYSVDTGYVEHLSRVLECHRRENVMSHTERFRLEAGDASERIDAYLERHPETIVALAYFDMQLYEPTKACLQAIRPHLTRGSVIAMDELNSPEFPGETVAFREVLGLDTYRLRRSRILPDRTYLVVE